WGRAEECETVATITALSQFLPPPPPGAPGRVEMLLEQAGLTPLTDGEVDCPFAFPDLETAVRGTLSSCLAVVAIRQAGAEAVQQAIAESLAPFRKSDSRYLQ